MKRGCRPEDPRSGWDPQELANQRLVLMGRGLGRILPKPQRAPDSMRAGCSGVKPPGPQGRPWTAVPPARTDPGTDRLHGPEHHRDPVRPRARRPRRRSDPLLRLSAGSPVHPQDRRPRRSQHRDHPIARSRPRHRLPGKPASARRPDPEARSPRLRPRYRRRASTPYSPSSPRSAGSPEAKSGPTRWPPACGEGSSPWTRP